MGSWNFPTPSSPTGKLVLHPEVRTSTRKFQFPWGSSTSPAPANFPGEVPSPPGSSELPTSPNAPWGSSELPYGSSNFPRGSYARPRGSSELPRGSSELTNFPGEVSSARGNYKFPPEVTPSLGKFNFHASQELPRGSSEPLGKFTPHRTPHGADTEDEAPRGPPHVRSCVS